MDYGLSTALVSAQPEPPTAVGAQAGVTSSAGMEERVSLDLRSTEVTDAIKYLATKGNLNMSISKNVSGRVNLLLTDVPIRDVFDLILRANELAYDKQGTVYNVMTEAEYKALYGRKFSDLRQVKTFRLQYAVPQQAFNLLDTLKSEVGRILVDEESGTILVMETPEKMKEMEEALSTLEQQGTVRVFELRYAKAKDIEERLKDQLELNKLGFIKADERSNSVMVKTLPARMKEVEQFITALDRKTREVMIDSKIVKINTSNALKAGVDWDKVFANLTFNGIDKVGDFRKTTTGTAPNDVPAVARINLPDLKLKEALGSLKPEGAGLFNGSNLVFTTVSTKGYELFRFLETIGKTRIISNPRIMVTERQEATIHVGTREAYVTTTTTTGQSSSTTAEAVEFIDVGIKLLVTPMIINDDGFVTMKIKPEVSSVSKTLITKAGSEIPIVDTSTAETNVVVKDGATVIIGGLRKNQEATIDNQVPLIARLPLIGELFRQKNNADTVAELVVFITPHIVTGDELVTGDEDRFGGAVKPYRAYAPTLDRLSQSTDGSTDASAHRAP